MSRSALIRLVALTALVALLAVVFDRDPPGASTIAPGTPWLEALQGRVNDVAAIEVVTPDETMTLERTDGAWLLTSWGGYPADFDAVKRTVVGLSGLTLAAARTARPERHADLQLGDPGAPGSRSLGVTLRDDAGEVLADVVLGKGKGADGLFVREAGQDQTWQVAGTVDVPRTPLRWVPTELLRLPADEVTSVQVQAPGSEPLTIERVWPDDEGAEDGAAAPSGAPEWTLADLPEGRELVPSPPFARLAGALANLDLTGVAVGEEAARERDWTTTRYDLLDAVTVTVQSAEDDDGGDAWLRLGFGITPGVDELTAPAEVRAAELAGRLSSWTFRVASWKVGAFRLDLDDLLEPLPEVGPALPPDEDDPDASDGDG